MTKDKWWELVCEEWEKFDNYVRFPLDARDWPIQRIIIMDHIKEMDKITEIFNMENKGE